MLALIVAGCSSTSGGTGSSGGNNTATTPAGTGSSNSTAATNEKGDEVRRVHARQRGQRVPGSGRVGRVDHRWSSERLVGGPEQRCVQAGHLRLNDTATT